MPRAEVGSTKYLNNKLKAKGLQRLRWYCQVCERQMRDENGFKQHTMSEAHVRQMVVVGENSGKFIANYSRQFQQDFITLLRTAHGTKKVNINHFYQEYIANKEHVHMNATRWNSLSEFAKFLGREGICRVEESDKGGFDIAWVDNSPEALRRQDAVRRKERLEKGDEEWEQRLIREQIRRAQKDAEEKGGSDDEEERRELKREEGEKITLDFGAKKAEPESKVESDAEVKREEAGEQEPAKTTLSFKPVSNKPKNVFAAAAKKNALAGSKTSTVAAPAKPMSEAERIMRAEMERKRPFSQTKPGLNTHDAKRVKT